MNSVIGHQPPVTRCYIVASASLMLLCSLDVLSPFSLYLNWQLIVYELQLWRLVTCFLFFGTFGLPFFWNTYVLMFYCSSLEDVASTANLQISCGCSSVVPACCSSS